MDPRQTLEMLQAFLSQHHQQEQQRHEHEHEHQQQQERQQQEHQHRQFPQPYEETTTSYPQQEQQQQERHQQQQPQHLHPDATQQQLVGRLTLRNLRHHNHHQQQPQQEHEPQQQQQQQQPHGHERMVDESDLYINALASASFMGMVGGHTSSSPHRPGTLPSPRPFAGGDTAGASASIVHRPPSSSDCRGGRGMAAAAAGGGAEGGQPLPPQTQSIVSPDPFSIEVSPGRRSPSSSSPHHPRQHSRQPSSSASGVSAGRSSNSNSLPRDLTDRERFVLFVKILLRCLDQSGNPRLKPLAKATIGECTRRNRLGDSAYTPLREAVERRLRPAVGEGHWTRAEVLCDRYCHRRRHGTSGGGGGGPARSVAAV